MFKVSWKICVQSNLVLCQYLPKVSLSDALSHILLHCLIQALWILLVNMYLILTFSSYMLHVPSLFCSASFSTIETKYELNNSKTDLSRVFVGFSVYLNFLIIYCWFLNLFIVCHTAFFFLLTFTVCLSFSLLFASLITFLYVFA